MVSSMWAPANLVTLVHWFLLLLDSTCRATWWRFSHPGDAEAFFSKRDSLPKSWQSDKDTPPPVVIVTGAGSGIGYATAARLTEMGLSVVVVCGTVEEAEQTCDLIREKTKKAKSKRSELIPRGADLRKGKEVVKLVAGLGDLEVRCVVHCAGVFGVSCEKFADVIGVNAAAPFLLTELLVERRRGQKNKNNKKYAPPLRLVFVGSFTHRGVTVSQVMRVWESLLTDCGKGGKDLRDKGNKDISDKNKAARLTPAEVYAFSKLAVTSFAYVFSTRYESVSIGDESLSHNSSRSESRKVTEEEHEHVTCAVADPGLVDTKINRGWPFTLRVSYVFVAR